MNNASIVGRTSGTVLSGALFFLASCASSSPEAAAPAAAKPSEIRNEFTAAAQVVAIAPAERRVTLRREDGAQIDVVADASVRNFDQVKVGDMLRVRYREMLVATRCAPGERMDEVQGALVAGRAPVGDKPAAGAAAGIKLRVRIESIDLEHELVTFSLASGELMSRRLRTPEGREFARGLKVGDVVQLEMGYSVALSVETLPK